MDNNNQLNNGNQLDPNAALNNQNYNNVANNQVYYNNTAQTGNVNDAIYSQAYYNNVGTLNPVNIQANNNNMVQNGTAYQVNNQTNYNNTVQNSSVNNVGNTGNVGTTNTMNKPNTTNNSSTDNEAYLKLDKIARQLASDFLVLGVFVVIILILSILSGKFNFFNIVHLGIIVAGHSAAKELKPSAGVFGIIMGILLIISFSLIDLLLGIFIIIRSIKYNSLIKKV